MRLTMSRQREPGWWYPWIFVVGMLVVIAVNIAMITLALGTFPGLETQDAYQKGLAYNQTIAAADAQVARGWRMDVVVAPTSTDAAAAATGGHTADVDATFTDRNGDPLAGLEVHAYLIRPTNVGSDMETELVERSGGHYAATLAVPLPGQWDIRIHARRGDDTYQATHRIMMP